MPPRRDPTGNGNNNNEVSAYMQQLLQGQAQLIQLLTQNMGNNNNVPPPPPVDTLARFLRLNPQRFSSTPKPIVADERLRYKAYLGKEMNSEDEASGSEFESNSRSGSGSGYKSDGVAGLAFASNKT